MRKYAGWGLLAGVVALLIAANLAMREDPEPTGSGSRSAPHVTPPSIDWIERDESRDPLEHDEAPRPDEDPVPTVMAAACDHPFIPTQQGQWRSYTWTQSDQEREATLRIEAGETRAVDGELSIGWTVRVVANDDDAELAEETLETRCASGEAAEEPWFGILERSLGLRLAGRRGRWRWPAALSAGQSFSGTARFDPRRAAMAVPDGTTEPDVLRVTRDHRVVGQESVEVPAGRFEAWRVDYEERQAFGEHGETGSGTVWVAEGVGLVRSQASNSENVSQTMVLAARSED
ncbi:MAG: hypothetical protein AB7S26_11060 [Sandaracinaceae bacterium]